MKTGPVKVLISIQPWFWDWFDSYGDLVQRRVVKYESNWVRCMLNIAMEVK
jgi:hypothetical protein